VSVVWGKTDCAKARRSACVCLRVCKINVTVRKTSALEDTELNKSNTSQNVNFTILHKERVE